MKTKSIGCLFGSFNPPHMGHLIIAQYMATRMGIDEVQLIVSPQNPLKEASGLAPAEHRLKMTRMATARNALLKVNAVEFKLPVPSYTINTLEHLQKAHPRNSYRLIIGSDNLAVFRQWKDWERILKDFGCLVYMRPGHPVTPLSKRKGVEVCHAPYLDISATYVRERINGQESIRYLVAPSVEAYIVKHGLYRRSD